MGRLTVKLNGTYEIKGIEDVPCGDVCERNHGCETCKIHEAVEKLAEYENAEEQGLLLRLPCKVGDTAYYVHREYLEDIDKWINTIDEVEVDSFVININIFANVSLYVCGERFGKTLTPYKTLFFTKKEAAQALARMEGENE